MRDRDPPRPNRRLRVTSGCKTCRARHVKCDERRPVCRNCAKKNRSCLYDRQIESLGGTSPVRRRVSETEKSQPVTPRQSQEHVPASPERTPGVVLGETHSASTIDVADARQSPLNETPPVALESPVTSTPFNLRTILQHGDLGKPHVETQTESHALVGPTDLYHREVSYYSPTAALHVDHKIVLSGIEVQLFRNYVDRVSKWVDSFSHEQPFYCKVPVLALRCPVLLYSCMAMSSKQMSLVALHDERDIYGNHAVYYYQQALGAMSGLIERPEVAKSDEILASSIILSTYEMLDVIGDSFGSHLQGVASLISSYGINGNQPGIRGAVYWTWYRHDIWAALQTGRAMILTEEYWQPPPVDSYSDLSVQDIANRVVFIFGQCVTLCMDDSAPAELQNKWEQADRLEQALEDWNQKLPRCMTDSVLSQSSPRPTNGSGLYGFPSMWFIYPQSGIAHQAYHASKILLSFYHRPQPSGVLNLTQSSALSSRRQIENSRQQILMVANAGVGEIWSLFSTQCLYVAGLVTEGVLERQCTLELIEECQKISGRRTVCIADQLRRYWAQEA